MDKSRINDLIHSPEEFLSRDGLMLNAPYYITRHINAALNRIFLEIFNIDLNHWYSALPKKVRELSIHSKKAPNGNQYLRLGGSSISGTSKMGLSLKTGGGSKLGLNPLSGLRQGSLSSLTKSKGGMSRAASSKSSTSSLVG